MIYTVIFFIITAVALVLVVREVFDHTQPRINAPNLCSSHAFFFFNGSKKRTLVVLVDKSKCSVCNKKP